MTSLPNRRARYLLLAELLRARPEAGQAPWHEKTFWQEMIQMADLNGVTTALPLALRQTGLWATVPEDLKTVLDAAHDLNEERTAAHLNEALIVHDVLTQAGIPCVFLKGTAYLFSGLFADDPGQRMTTDIDVLVPRESIAGAQDALFSLGFTTRNETWPNLDLKHHIPALLPARGLGQFSVELHVRPVEFPWERALSAGNVFERAQLTSVEGRSVRIPCPQDMFLQGLIHAAAGTNYHLRRIPLRDAIDIGRLGKRVKTDQMQLLPFLDKTKRRRLSNYLEACLALQGENDARSDTGGKFSYHRQVLFWAGIKRNQRLEDWFIANWLYLTTHPLDFVKTKPKKLGDPEFYRRLLATIRRKRV